MRSLFTAVATLTVVIAACGGDPGSGLGGDESPEIVTTASPSTTSTPSTASTVAPDDGGPLPEGPSALDDMLSPEFPDPLVDVSQILSGGPPPDGIPAIDEPQFITVEQAGEWLDDREPVVVVELGGEARAYPVQILIWHEIVNDTVAGVPVAVTYCPLCNSAVSYRRTIDGVETTFGTSGRLFASALVMYDRATESLWTHYDGRAVVGVLTGHELDSIASPLLAWQDFKGAHPSGLVLDRDATGYSRRYGDNPYVGYDAPDGTPFLFRGALDDRAAAMQRIVGVVTGGDAKAWALGAVSDPTTGARATNATVGGTRVVIFWKAGQSSALDDQAIERGADVGSVGVFDVEVDGRALTFESTADGHFVDVETRSIWDVTGRAIAGELAGTNLTRIVHLDTFWFAWATYRPGTELITE